MLIGRGRFAGCAGLCAVVLCIAISVAAQDQARKEGQKKEDSKKEELKGDVSRGKVVFQTVCEECHDGYSKEEFVGPGLKGMKDGKLPNGRPATRESLLNILNWGPAEMPSMEERLTEQQKRDVIEFVLTL
jgi:mono/diheme cytochrome c family protein